MQLIVRSQTEQTLNHADGPPTRVDAGRVTPRPRDYGPPKLFLVNPDVRGLAEVRIWALRVHTATALPQSRNTILFNIIVRQTNVRATWAGIGYLTEEAVSLRCGRGLMEEDCRVLKEEWVAETPNSHSLDETQ
ncbi:hypothetical protein EVAR_25435_1 [Eumeta japonica]|uniref:Uncharacterized protein n=1 Tax=Eumeta variegata TaxID=151549 RepID=A0A4C1V4T6_EUMVA|nr:hypothetical protein EVAR_25435_1 [Eumeta japonica]